MADHSGSGTSCWSKVNTTTIEFISTLHPRIVWFHVKMWRVGANRNRRGLNLSQVTEADFDMLMEPGPEDLIANCSPPSLPSNNKPIDDLVVEFWPFCLLSRLMLESSLKGMHRLNCREALTAQRLSRQELEFSMMYLDMHLMSQFGKLNTH